MLKSILVNKKKWQTIKGLKIIGIVIGVFLIGSLYIYYLDTQRQQVLQDIALSIIHTCRQEKKCITIPDEFNAHYNKQNELTMISHQNHSMMIYKTHDSDERFTLNWRVATGTTFMATGGVSSELNITKRVD